MILYKSDSWCCKCICGWGGWCQNNNQFVRSERPILVNLSLSMCYSTISTSGYCSIGRSSRDIIKSDPSFWLPRALVGCIIDKYPIYLWLHACSDPPFAQPWPVAIGGPCVLAIACHYLMSCYPVYHCLSHNRCVVFCFFLLEVFPLPRFFLHWVRPLCSEPPLAATVLQLLSLPTIGREAAGLACRSRILLGCLVLCSVSSMMGI